MPENIGDFVAWMRPKVLVSSAVTSRQLLAASLSALLHQSRAKAQNVAKVTGIDGATLSKFQTDKDHLWRWPTDRHFDALASFFGVAPFVLLRPDLVVSAGGSDTWTSEQTAQAHTKGVATSTGLPLHSSSPSYTVEEASMRDRPDRHIFAAVEAVWDALDADGRIEYIRRGQHLLAERQAGATAAKRLG